MNANALILIGLLSITSGCLSSPITENRVIGGNDAPKGFAPYQVSIQNTFGEHVCGGSIINSQWILTAAHCMDWPKEYLKIVTGTVNWKQPGAEYFVDEVKIHCLHDKPKYHNDIALLHLSEPIAYNDYTKPVALATSNTLNDGDILVLTGWGSTKTWGGPTNLLQRVNLKYEMYGECAQLVQNAKWLGNGHICTLNGAGEGSCHGDSGGPLVDADHVQVGIVNWGDPCANGYPDVYASVAYYNDWIKTTMAGSNSC